MNETLQHTAAESGDLSVRRKTLGRNAVLVHGIALVCASIAATAHVSGAAMEIVVMGAVAWLVLCGWSAVLALRSIVALEESVPAAAVGAMAYVEFFAFIYLMGMN